MILFARPKQQPTIDTYIFKFSVTSLHILAAVAMRLHRTADASGALLSRLSRVIHTIQWSGDSFTSNFEILRLLTYRSAVCLMSINPNHSRGYCVKFWYPKSWYLMHGERVDIDIEHSTNTKVTVMMKFLFSLLFPVADHRHFWVLQLSTLCFYTF